MISHLTRWIFCNVNYFTFSVIFGLLILIFYYYKSKTSTNDLQPLPGPRGFPVVGYFPFLGSKPYLIIHELTKKYGPILRVQLGSLPCLFLCNFEVVREAFVKQSDIYSDRPKNLPFLVYENESAFIVDDGITFKDVKMFSLDTLKKLGFGKSSLENFIKLEVQDLIDEINKFNKQPLDVAELLERSIGNALCTLLCEKRSTINDPWLISLIEAVNKLQECSTYDHSFFFPWLKKIPFWRNITNYRKSCFWKNKMWRLLQEKIDDVKKDIADKNERECYISAWIREQEKRNAIDHPYKSRFSDFNLRSNMELFTRAGIETASATILWCLQYLIKRPDVRNKIKEEIDSQINGKKFDLSFAEAKNFPYLRAVIQETHRLACVVPFGVFHCTSERSVLSVYDIPKGITTMACVYSVQCDPTYFPDPEEFKPERFLTDDGEFIRCEKVIAFSVGKRSCPGEFVAQMEIFHFLTTILYEFELLLGPNNVNFGKGKGSTVINFLLNITVIFKPRKIN